MNSNRQTVLIEAGGTGIRLGIAGPDGPVLMRRVMFSVDGDRPSTGAVLDLIAETAVDALGAAPTRAVVAWPGPGPPGGAAPATPTGGGGIEQFDVGPELGRRLGSADVHVVNHPAAAGAGPSAAALPCVGAIPRRS